MGSKLSTFARRPLVSYLLTTAIVDALIDNDRRLINSRSTMSDAEQRLRESISQDLLDELRSRQLELPV